MKHLNALKGLDQIRTHKFKDGESWIDVSERVSKIIHLLLKHFINEK
jgi:hypothetical protein